MKRTVNVVIGLLLIISLGFNVYMINFIREKQARESTEAVLVFEDANSRDTYATIHNVPQAHNITKGAGVKVGVLDMYFAYEEHPNLYQGGQDFANQNANFMQREQHGYWMALTLKEMAPDVDIYALGVDAFDEDKRVEQMIQAIDWAIEHELDVLTYSNAPFSEENSKKLDIAVEKAATHNIVTTFIWYANPRNILPGGLKTKLGDGYEADINIYHFDYSTVRVGDYQNFRAASAEEKVKMMHPFMSYSSTSPVAAAFVALLKSINNDLAPATYKKILIETSREMIYNEELCPRVVDIFAAVNRMKIEGA